ncbi:MAG TPA: AbrB family transcriptional regulator [Pseudonocardia sp.]|nr:AbrB family transcriptional regulator [Pseudonocardia sp.]
MQLPNGPGWAWLVVLTAIITGGIALLGMPSPALFGGLLAATVLALVGRAPTRVPSPVNVAAMAVIGVVIGGIARPETLTALAGDTVPVLLVGVATLLVSMAAGLLMGLSRDVSPLTGMLALTAGGASGLTAVARELGGDERVVVVVQYLRVGVVTATMPVVAALVYGAAGGGDPAARAGPTPAPWYVDIVFLLVSATVGVAISRLTRMPAGALLGPMLVALGLSLAGWSFGASPPEVVVELGYAVIGWQAGLRFTRESLRTVIGVLPLAGGLIVAVIAACAGLGLALSALTGTTPLEGYLATTPGGVYAVLATAISAGVDVTFVVAVQVLRVIVMLLLAPAVARLIGRGNEDRPLDP